MPQDPQTALTGSREHQGVGAQREHDAVPGSPDALSSIVVAWLSSSGSRRTGYIMLIPAEPGTPDTPQPGVASLVSASNHLGAGIGMGPASIAVPFSANSTRARTSPMSCNSVWSAAW